MKKYKFVSLFIGLTRRCNQACAHCGKGDAQNLSMSTAIIDKIFSDIADCQRIVIGSGEATLEMDLIEYLINRIINSSWTTDYTLFGTDEEIRELFASVGLDALESYYISHPDEAVDYKIFTCKTEDDDKPFNIDYTLHTPRTDGEPYETIRQALEEDTK